MKINKQLLISITITCVLTLAIIFYVFRLWEIDFKTPFNYWGDTLWFIIPIKGMIQDGWVYDIKQLSAPFSLSAAGFPSMTHFDWVVMKLISYFVNDAGTVLNMFWLLSIIFTALSATISLSIIGINRIFAIFAALVYAFLPFTFLRNVGHISLVYYTVPLIVLLAFHIAKGCKNLNEKEIIIMGFFALFIQGFNYLYFSFFSVLLIIFSGYLGYVQNKSWNPIKISIFASIFIIAISSINLYPSIYSWSKHGKPPSMDYKSASEAETFGLKIRKMLVPHEDNILPLFSHWGQRDKSINFPIENENVTARLGPMAATGLIILFMVSIGCIRKRTTHHHCLSVVAALALFSILFTTVGGLGAIFNQVLPDFRAYNRFSVFIAFLAIAGLCLWFQSLMENTGETKRKIIIIGFTVFAVFSLHDQILDASHLNNRRPVDELLARHEQNLVKIIESKVPTGALVFQMPITGFPPDGGIGRMLPYDHARPYLWSSHLHWSWPSFSQRHRAWLDQTIGMNAVELSEFLVLSGFRLVWVDTFGYDDNGSHIITSLISAGAYDIAPEASERYVILDLIKIYYRLNLEYGSDEFKKRSLNHLNTPVLQWGYGFFTEEKNQNGNIFRWSQKESTLIVRNITEYDWEGHLYFITASANTGTLDILSNKQSHSISVSHHPITVEFPLTLKPMESSKLNFVGDMGRIPLPPGETRDLHFYVMDLQLKPRL